MELVGWLFGIMRSLTFMEEHKTQMSEKEMQKYNIKYLDLR